jgi:hypothetical protein
MSSHAVCLEHGRPDGVPAIASPEIWELVPEPTRDLIRSKAIEGPAPDWNEHDRRCLYEGFHRRCPRDRRGPGGRRTPEELARDT